LHGKVAVFDETWATVGSSNLDPSSLSLNHEANVIVWDRRFALELKANLEGLISRHCMSTQSEDFSEPVLWRRWVGFFVFHLIRQFPSWDRWLPKREQPVLPAPVAMEVAPPPEPPAATEQA
jgi:cardiolipin synthase